jgi:hypothetical protein
MTLKVPVLRNRVSETPLPAARVSGGQVGTDLVSGEIGRLGGQIGQLGRTVQAVETEEQRRADKQASEQARVQAEFKKREDTLHADKAMTDINDWFRNKQPEYTAGQGLDARGSTDLMNKDLETRKNELLANAKNEEQRALINAAFAPKREVWLNKQKGFEVGEFRTAEVAANQSKIQNAIRDASDNFDDPLALQLAKDELRDGINVTIKGMAPEQRKNVTAEYVSALHEGVLNNMVTSSAEAARVYYDDNKKNILPEHRDEIERVLQTEDTLQFAQQKTDEIMRAESDYEKQLEMARDIEDPEKREATVSLVKTRKKETDQLDKEGAREVRLNDLSNVLDAPDLESAMEIVNRIDNADDRIKAQKVADNRFEKKTRANDTDRDVQATVYEKIASGEIKEVRDLIEYAPDLSDGDYTRMITEIENKDKNGRGIGTAYIKDATAKNAYALVKGLPFDIEKHSKEYMYVREGLDRLAQEKGRDLTPVEAQQEAAKLIVSGELPGTGIIWSDKLTRQEAEQTGKMDIWLPRINEDDVDNGQELRELKEWSAAKLKVSDPSDELLGMIKREGAVGVELSESQRIRFNELILKEKDR